MPETKLTKMDGAWWSHTLENEVVRLRKELKIARDTVRTLYASTDSGTGNVYDLIHQWDEEEKTLEALIAEMEGPTP